MVAFPRCNNAGEATAVCASFCVGTYTVNCDLIIRDTLTTVPCHPRVQMNLSHVAHWTLRLDLST